MSISISFGSSSPCWFRPRSWERPIARALGQFADGLRTKRLMLAEEHAAKTTVKLIFPLALFIFPALFIVLLGPGVLTMLKTLEGQINHKQGEANYGYCNDDSCCRSSIAVILLAMIVTRRKRMATSSKR